MPSGYLSLCYHYIRPEKNLDQFPNLLGNSESEFREHIRMVKSVFSPISLEEAKLFSYSNFSVSRKKYGLLFTFDDGLSDHYRAAEMLAEEGVQGAFFIPTCILKDNLPANPVIIHYALARYRIGGFLDAYRCALEQARMDVDQYDISFEKGKDDPWEKISEIKLIFKTRFEQKTARTILLYIYAWLLKADMPDIFRIMHLTKEKICEIIAMGHAIGTHSHTHLSSRVHELSQEDFDKEIIWPQQYLEKEIGGGSVYAMSYPFGTGKETGAAAARMEQSKTYDLAFTTEKILNETHTNPYALGRYKPMSSDRAEDLKKILGDIIHNS